MHELIARSYYWLMLYQDIDAYIKDWDIYLALKTVHRKFYNNFQAFLVCTHYWTNLLINFVTSLPISTNQKDNSYDLIFVIVNYFIKIVHYEPVNVTVNTITLGKVIIDVMVWYYNFFKSIVTDQDYLFMFKFWFLSYYFLDIK